MRKPNYKLVTAVVFTAVVVLALYIMVNGLGLVPELDFGAGAYYYADIPEFEKYMPDDSTSGHKILVWVLFFVWAVLMWLLWRWIERKNH